MRNTAKISAFLFMAALFVMMAGSGFSQGLRWETLPNAPISNSRMDDVFFVSPSTGWIISSYCDFGGCFGDVWKTTDGGDSWSLQVSFNMYLRSLGFLDSLNGWVGTVFDDTAVLFRTTDGGASWNLVQNIPEPKPKGICGNWVVNDSVMYASGRFFGPARVIKTTDRGASWTSQDLSAHAGALVDCYFFSPDSGFVVGSSSSDYDTGHARVLFTSDGGNNWTTRYAGTRLGELCWKIQFRTKNIGYVSIEKFQPGPTYYLKTTDGGVTWSDKLFQDTLYDAQGIGFVSDSVGWIGGWGGDTYETKDAGASWHLAGFGQIINRFRFINDTLAYAVGLTVYKYSPCPMAGDANASRTYTLADVIATVNYIFNKPGCSPQPLCWISSLLCRGDWNGDNMVSLVDVLRGVNYLFSKPGGPWNAVPSGVCCL
jgi:photosystem II stability/assembly factor-like uncharacterized protein